MSVLSEARVAEASSSLTYLKLVLQSAKVQTGAWEMGLSELSKQAEHHASTRLMPGTCNMEINGRMLKHRLLRVLASCTACKLNDQINDLILAINQHNLG